MSKYNFKTKEYVIVELPAHDNLFHHEDINSGINNFMTS